MKNYNLILFDLDGTLTDSGPGILNAVEYALKKLGAAVPDRGVLRRFVGPPLEDSFQAVCGFDRERAKEAVKAFREYYGVTGVYENSVYEGIKASLSRLKSAGKLLAVATNKPEKTALLVLEHFSLNGFFDIIVGSDEGVGRDTKAKVVAYALEKGRSAGANAFLMVGDREHDVVGAKANAIDCMGVLYGYGSREELEKAGVDYLAATPSDIAGIILNGR